MTIGARITIWPGLVGASPFTDHKQEGVLECEVVSYGVPNVSKSLTNAIFVYLPLIYKCGTDLAKYLPDLYIWA